MRYILEDVYKAEEDYIKMVGKPVGWCPMIKGTCNPGCVCYVPAKIVKGTITCRKIHVYPPYCSNVSLVGGE